MNGLSGLCPQEGRRSSVVNVPRVCAYLVHKNLDVAHCTALRTYIDRQIDRLHASNRAGSGHWEDNETATAERAMSFCHGQDKIRTKLQGCHSTEAN